jgi:uncharacterized protein YijF (DUF1287 family)
MLSKRVTKAKRAANLVVVRGAKLSSEYPSKWPIDKPTTNASKARLRGLATLAKAKKSARIQGLLAYGPTVYIDP